MTWKRALGRLAAGSRFGAVLLALVVVCGLLTPRVLDACAVCYGDVDSPMTKGMNNGILVLLGVVAAVQGGFVGLFLSIRLRMLRQQRRRARVHLVHGGAG